VSAAKLAYPNNTFVQKAIATSMGRRLDAVRDFTSLHNLPDLTSLVVSKATGDNGIGFAKSFDGDAVRQQVSAFEWQSVQISFSEFLNEETQQFIQRQAEKAQRKPKKIKESEAREIWWKYYQANKEAIGKISDSDKEQIIQLIMTCVLPADALAKVKSVVMA
jgi:glutamate synthase domain-containing protein 1